MARRIVTAEDVLALPEGGRLLATDDMTVTSAARELARRRNITVVEGAEAAAAPADAEQAAQAAPTGAPGTIIVTAVGVNRPGVLSELTSAIGQLHGDIQDVSQRITGGWFNAILVVDIKRSGQSFAAFREALKGLSQPRDYVVTVIDERVFTAMHRLG
ncbi:MAG TPA: ACT domain-containing protein [Planctomycetota bacterium]|nr:ACT domain-containing protein [Planctomycetota bacterium]